MTMDYNNILDMIVENVKPISGNKRYWLIRTQGGELFDTFYENNFVGLDHQAISLGELSVLRTRYLDDFKFHSAIKEAVTDFYTEDLETGEKSLADRTITLIANQIYKFYRQVKKGDIVIIPSYSSTKVAFGEVLESNIASFNEGELRQFDHSIQFLNKRVKWIKEFDRRDLDPNIFKMFTAHQAINEVNKYAHVIERTLQDFFILDNKAHLIINVQQRAEINARGLFGLGNNFLDILDGVIAHLEIEGVDTNDFQVEVNINSRGKIDLKSLSKKGTVIALITLSVFGGGFEYGDFSLKTEGLVGFVQAVGNAISDYKDREQTRNMQVQIFNEYKRKLDVKNVDDMIKVMKQIDENKDKPK